MSAAEFLGALAAVVVAGITGPIIALVMYLREKGVR